MAPEATDADPHSRPRSDARWHTLLWSPNALAHIAVRCSNISALLIGSAAIGMLGSMALGPAMRDRYETYSTAGEFFELDLVHCGFLWIACALSAFFMAAPLLAGVGDAKGERAFVRARMLCPVQIVLPAMVCWLAAEVDVIESGGFTIRQAAPDWAQTVLPVAHIVGSWYFAGGLLVAALVLYVRAARMLRRWSDYPSMRLCPTCGYDLRGLPLGRPCPECGRSPLAMPG